MKMWISHHDCRNVIEQSWSNNIVGCPMYALSQKLKMLKEKLKVWNQETFGDIHLQAELLLLSWMKFKKKLICLQIKKKSQHTL